MPTATMMTEIVLKGYTIYFKEPRVVCGGSGYRTRDKPTLGNMAWKTIRDFNPIVISLYINNNNKLL